MLQNIKSLFVLQLVVVFGLFLYSFTQIDLNLTLADSSIWQSIQGRFMYVGYYQRPMSMYLYISILFLLFATYLSFLRLANRGKLSLKIVFYLIISTIILLLISYPAFSHDIFNYMFDAKTVIKYNLVPYFVRPLDIVGDPWLNFMRWTHAPSIYPPLWILLTLPVYTLGLSKIVLIIINFKLISVASYFFSSYLVLRIMERINYRYRVSALIFFALNPLVIIEALVSGHNDIFMMSWALLAFYTAQRFERISTLFFLAVATGIKYVAIALLPLVLFGARRTLALLLSLAGLLLVLTQREVQPWYLLWVLPFAALSVDRKIVVYTTVGLSLGLLLRYAPFIYLGHWDSPVSEYKFWLTVVPTTIGIAVGVYHEIRAKKYI